MATVKTCFKCGTEKSLDCFYRHSHMADGHLNKCKSCTKNDVRLHRERNDSVREYDRTRSKLPHRIDNVRMQSAKNRRLHPARKKAQTIAGNALRAGLIKPHPCWVCGDRAEMHHPDYSQPLDIVWLCSRHHKQTHALLTRTEGD